MEIENKKDYGEFIRSGARITLKLLVNYVNEKLQNQFGKDWIKIANYIYRNQGGSSGRELRINENGRIEWDFYAITSFLATGSRDNQAQQPINEEKERINFKKVLFPELRDDLFQDFRSFATIRNILSHASYDGEVETGYANWIDADKYLSSMRLVISQIDQNSQYNNEIEQIIKDCDKVKNEFNKFLNDNQKRSLSNLERKRSDFDGQNIGFSTINKLDAVTKEKKTRKYGKKTDCICLYFEDTNDKRVMYKFFDKNGEIEKKCHDYVGKMVVTSTWMPDKFPPQEWFRNIFLADKLN